MAQSKLTPGERYRVELAGKQGAHQIAVEKVEGGQVTFRQIWIDRATKQLVTSPKAHTRPVSELTIGDWSKSAISRFENPKAEAPKEAATSGK